MEGPDEPPAAGEPTSGVLLADVLRPPGSRGRVWVFVALLAVVSIAALGFGLRRVKNGLAPVRATDAYLAAAATGPLSAVRAHLCPALSDAYDDATLQARIDAQRAAAPKGRSARVTGFGRPTETSPIEVNYALDLPAVEGGGPTTTTPFDAVVVEVVEVDGRWLACGTRGVEVPGALPPP